jgi:hypothetical protein
MHGQLLLVAVVNKHFQKKDAEQITKQLGIGENNEEILVDGISIRKYKCYLSKCRKSFDCI